MLARSYLRAPTNEQDATRARAAVEAVLRCTLLKQHRQLSYEELAFHLEDSASFRAFARLPLAWTPKKSVLQRTISAIGPETWEAINRAVLASARQEKVETGKVVRLDSTVAAALMHEPSDSSLLWDAVRVMVRLLKAAEALVGQGSTYKLRAKCLEDLSETLLEQPQENHIHLRTSSQTSCVSMASRRSNRAASEQDGDVSAYRY